MMFFGSVQNGPKYTQMAPKQVPDPPHWAPSGHWRLKTGSIPSGNPKNLKKLTLFIHLDPLGGHYWPFLALLVTYRPQKTVLPLVGGDKAFPGCGGTTNEGTKVAQAPHWVSAHISPGFKGSFCTPTAHTGAIFSSIWRKQPKMAVFTHEMAQFSGFSVEIRE